CGLHLGVLGLILSAGYVATVLSASPNPDYELLVSNAQFLTVFAVLGGVMCELNTRARRAQILARLELEGLNGQLQKALEAAQAAERAKSELFANVSHELRTPLMLNLGPLDAVLDGETGPLSPAQERMLALAHDSALRLRRQIDLFLDLARLDAGK